MYTLVEHAEKNLFYKHGLKRLLNPQRILGFFVTRYLLYGYHSENYGNLQMRLIKLSKGNCHTFLQFINGIANFLYDSE